MLFMQLLRASNNEALCTRGRLGSHGTRPQPSNNKRAANFELVLKLAKTVKLQLVPSPLVCAVIMKKILTTTGKPTFCAISFI